MSLRTGWFFKDERGTTFEGIALSVSILAVAFVASADMLDYATKTPDAPGMTAMHKMATPATVASADLDETPTASVHSSTMPSLPQLVSRSVLDPCTGTIK
jgi:hypothetical protein